MTQSLRHCFLWLVLLAAPNFAVAQTFHDIDDFALAFRVQIYETFHEQRHEYERRLEAGTEALAIHRNSDSRAARQEIMDWFVVAIQTSQPGSRLQFPQLPAAERLAELERQHAQLNRGRKPRVELRRRPGGTVKKNWLLPNQW